MIETIGNAKEVVQGTDIKVFLEQLGDGAVVCSQNDYDLGDCPTTL